MEDADQDHEEENGVDTEPAIDTDASGKYFDYVSYIRLINTTDADPALVHDQFYTDVPLTGYPPPDPVHGLARETHDLTVDTSQDLMMQGTEAQLRVSPEPHDVASDASSNVATEERHNRKRTPSQTSSEGKPAAKKLKRIKGVFHPQRIRLACSVA